MRYWNGRKEAQEAQRGKSNEPDAPARKRGAKRREVESSHPSTLARGAGGYVDDHRTASRAALPYHPPMRRRLRSTFKWGGAVATVVLVLVWAGSRWWACSTSIPYACTVNVSGGSLILQWSDSASLAPTAFSWSGPNRNILAFEWWFIHYSMASGAGETISGIFVPIWTLALLVGLPTAWMWYRDRRRAPGLCTKCGYDLRGADHAVCPECGAAVTRRGTAKPAARRDGSGAV